jgi:molybdopterin-guanine dinucleotide biosynthesis protein A
MSADATSAAATSAGATSAGRTGAVVLAGGRSSRFGRDKLAATIDGRPVLEHAIDAVRDVVDVVVVVLAPDDERPLPVGVEVARDLTAFEGPLAGLAAGLAALPDDVDRALVSGGDMPRMAGPVLALLLRTLVEDDAVDAVVLDEGGPLPMAIRRNRSRQLAEDLLAAGERRLRAVPESLGATVIDGETWRAVDPAGATLLDIDEPSDLP